MKRSELKNMIRESVQRHFKRLNENIDDMYNKQQFEDVISEVESKAQQYERYAQQLRYGIKNITSLVNEVAEEINNVFGTNINVQNFTNFSLDSDVFEFVTYIPVQNFIQGCKNNQSVMEDVKFQVEDGEYPQVTDELILKTGLYGGWDNMFYFNPEDKNNKVSFSPRLNQANPEMIECNIEILNAFSTWD